MSWSASFPEPVEFDNLEETLHPDRVQTNCRWNAETQVSDLGLPESWGPEVVEAFEAARTAAWDLIAGGTLGGEGKTFNVSLSGHANPGHEPAPGWVNDCVSVNVSQRAPEA